MAGIHRGENFNLEGLPGTFDVITHTYPGQSECSGNVDQQVGWYDTESVSRSLGTDESDEVQEVR